MSNTMASATPNKKWFDPASPTMDGELDFEIGRLRSVALTGWDKESRTLKQFGLGAAMHLLEIGCGPGFMTELMAGLIPGGSITAIDAFPPMVEHADGYLRGRSSVPVKVMAGTATEIPLPDNSCDFAVSRLVFQHVTDVVAGAKEIFRVLKPGGKVVIADVDFDLATLSDPIIPRYKTIRDRSLAANSARGADVYTGRRLWRNLKKAGFVNLDVETVVQHSGDRDIREFSGQLNPALALPLVQMGLMSDHEMAELYSEVDAFMSSDDPFYMRVLVMVCGQKPL
jgi:ubiquinone/menaquinone biosynthesis C-methylase UbiE